MTNNIRFPNRTKLNTQRVKKLFKFMQEKYINRDDRSFNDVISRVFSGFAVFFQNLGKPSSKDAPLSSKDERTPSSINDTFADIEDDLDVAYEESKALRESSAETFNYFSTQRRSLMSKIRKAASKVVSLKLQSDKFGNEFIYAGDDFVDTSKIDLNFTLHNSPADIPVGLNLSTLQRVDNINRSENVVDILVESNKPELHYEGLYYGLAGESRPEGGKYFFEEVQTKLLQVDQVYSVTGGSESTQYQVGDEDVRLRLRKATEDQLKKQRARMIDGDPRSFWEIEYSFATSEELGKYAQNEESGEVVPIFTPEQITDMVKRDHDKEDFTVEVTFKFQSSFVMNWINLIPHVFGNGNWIEVVNIETSIDGTSFESLDGLFDGKYENSLTDEANAELTKKEIASTLSPTKFSYIGTGLWTFAPRQMQFVKFTLKQKTPAAIPYHQYTFQLKNVGTTTTTVGKKSGWF